MDWAPILTLAGVNIALIACMATLVIWAISKLDADVKSCSADVKACMGRLDSHATRIDQLYQMFVDLLKEGRK